MPQIPQISGPLTGGKTMTTANGSQGNEPFSLDGVNPVQKPADVSQKGGAGIGASAGSSVSGGGSAAALASAKDPSMAVETLHDVFSGDLLENAKLNGYTELVGEIDDLTRSIYIEPDKLMNEILTQEKDNTVFSGNELFNILRDLCAGAEDDTKELVADLLKSLNYAMSRNEILDAITSNIKFLADYFGEGTSLSKSLYQLYAKWTDGNPADNFEPLKNETAALMRTISASLQNDAKTEVLVPLVTYNLSRYNTNEYMMKDAFTRLMSQVPSASMRESLNRSFGKFVTDLLEKNNGYSYNNTTNQAENQVFGQNFDSSAEKTAILNYLSRLLGSENPVSDGKNQQNVQNGEFQPPETVNLTNNQNNGDLRANNGGAVPQGSDLQDESQNFVPQNDGQQVNSQDFVSQNNNLQGNLQGENQSFIPQNDGQQVNDQDFVSQNNNLQGNLQGENQSFVPQNDGQQVNGQDFVSQNNNLQGNLQGENQSFIPQNDGQQVNNQDFVSQNNNLQGNLQGENQNFIPQNDGQQVNNQGFVSQNNNLQGENQSFVPQNNGQQVNGQDFVSQNNNLQGENQNFVPQNNGQQVNNQGFVSQNNNLQGENQSFVPQNDGQQVNSQGFISQNNNLQGENQSFVPQNSDLRRTNVRDAAQNSAGTDVKRQGEIPELQVAKKLSAENYKSEVPLSESRINFILNGFENGLDTGRDAIGKLLALIIPKSDVSAAETMQKAVDGTDDLNELVEFLNRVLEKMPDVPERQTLCDAFEQVLGKMARNHEMPAHKTSGYESETMKALTEFINRNVNHPAIRGIDNFNASNLLQSMLNAPGVFTPLAHYIIPLQVEDTRAFGELWVDNDNTSKSDGENSGEKHFHLFLTFDVEAVGRFEVNAYSKGKDLNLSVLYPKSYRHRAAALTEKITKIAAGVGYNVQNFTTGVLTKPHSLSETFPRINENRKSFDATA